jgi:hypothetical protein
VILFEFWSCCDAIDTRCLESGAESCRAHKRSPGGAGIIWIGGTVACRETGVWGTVTSPDLLLLRGGVPEAMEPDRLPEFLRSAGMPQALCQTVRRGKDN